MSTRTITFLSFDACYHYQKSLIDSLGAETIDLTQLRGTSLYCSDDAFLSIKGAVQSLPSDGLVFLGSGNYHYTTLALLEKFSRPFTLILVDHHTDMNEGRIGPLLSCGSWVNHAITNLPYLKKVVIIGPDPANRMTVLPSIRRQSVLLPENQLPDPATLLSLIPTDTIQLSIDKDVLSPHEAQTNWDQGQMSLHSLGQLVYALLAHFPDAGMDVCGEWPIEPHQQLNPVMQQAIARNMRSNRRLAEQFLHHERNSKAKRAVPIQHDPFKCY